MSLTYQKLMENNSKSELQEETKNAQTAARELGDAFHSIAERLKDEPKDSPKGILARALKGWGDHLENVSTRLDEIGAEDAVKQSVADLPMLQEFLTMQVPGSDQTFYQMTLDELKTYGKAESVEDGELVRQGFDNALQTIANYYELPLDLDKLQPQPTIEEQVQQEIEDIEDVNRVMEQQVAEMAAERGDPLDDIVEMMEEEEERAKYTVNLFLDEVYADAQAGLDADERAEAVADFFERAEAQRQAEQQAEQQPEIAQAEEGAVFDADKRPETAWPEGVQPAGQIISYQQLFDKDQKGEGFHNNKTTDRVMELGGFFDRAADKVRELGNEELAQQLESYGQSLRDATDAVYSAEMPQTLAKLGGLKDFLTQKGKDGKSNYQLVTEVLGDDKKWFDQDLEAFEKVAETGIGLEALNNAPQAQQPAEPPTTEDYALVQDAIRRNRSEFQKDAASAFTVLAVHCALNSLGIKDDVAVSGTSKYPGGKVTLNVENKEHAKAILDAGMAGFWSLKRDDGKTMLEVMRENCKDEQERRKLDAAVGKMQTTHKGVMPKVEPGKTLFTNKTWLEQAKKGISHYTAAGLNADYLKAGLSQIVVAQAAALTAPYQFADRETQKRQANELYDSQAFKEATKDLSAEQLDEHCKDPRNFIEGLAEKQNEIAQYKAKAPDGATFQRQTARLRTSLDATKTGSWLGIPRLHNSKKYQAARKAMTEAIRCANQPDSAGVNYKAAKAVQAYLKDKMGVRAREFGRERFNECMRFLKSVMPEKEFADYCAEVNTHRRKSADHIKPEDFEPKRNVNEIVRDQQAALVVKPTERDIAKMIAAYRISGDFGKSREKDAWGNRGVMAGDKLRVDDKKIIDGKALREMTDRVMAEDSFKEYIRLVGGVEKAAEIAQKNPEETALYSNVVLKAEQERQQREAQEAARQQEAAKREAQQLENELENEKNAKQEEYDAKLAREKERRVEYQNLYKTMDPEQKLAAKQAKNAGREALDRFMDNYKKTLEGKEQQKQNEGEELQQDGELMI